MSLSVVLLCHNQSLYLPATIELLSDCAKYINQLIFVDDASDDDSASLMTQAAERLDCAEIIVHQRNIGVLAVMQDVLERCTGDYVHFLACDDSVTEQFYSKCLSILARHPQAGLCSTATILMSEKGFDLGEFRASKPLQQAGYISPTKVRNTLYRLDSWFMGHATIFNRQRLLENNGFRQDLGGFSDAYACMLLGLKHGVCFVPETLAAKRRHGSPYGTTVYSPQNSPLILSALEQHMTEEPNALFDNALRRRIVGRWQFNAAMLRSKSTGRASPSLLTRLSGFLMYKPFDVISVLHRHWPSRQTKIKSS